MNPSQSTILGVFAFVGISSVTSVSQERSWPQIKPVNHSVAHFTREICKIVVLRSTFDD
jgi:hypothetical protein